METLKRMLKQIDEKSVSGTLNDLKKLYNCFIEIIDLLIKKDIKLPYIWYEYYEAIAIKFKLNVYSIIELYDIERDMNAKLIYHDLSSIYLLNRSLLESYLTFFYCFILPKSAEEGLMNYYIFKISGLVQRQGYRSTTQQSQKQKEQEKANIIEYQNKLNDLEIFKSLSLKTGEKKKLIAGKYAKRFSFPELIRMSKLKDTLFDDMWKIYSNYAHCELLSLLQINSYAEEKEDFMVALFSTLNNTLIVHSLMIKDFCSILQDTDAEKVDIHELDKEVITILDFWCLVGTEK